MSSSVTQQPKMAKKSKNPGPTRAQKTELKKAQAAKFDKSRVKASNNPYLRTLLKPEQCGGVRYSDLADGATAMVQGIINHDLYYFPADSSTTPSAEPAGTYYALTSPTLIHPILEYRMDKLQSVGEYLTLSYASQRDEEGLFPLTEDAASPASSSQQPLIATDGSLQNIRGVWTWSDQSFALPTLRSVLPDGTVMYGVPFTDDIPAGTFNVQLVGAAGFTLPVGTVITLYAYNSSGANVSGNQTLATATKDFGVTLNIAALLTTLANGTGAARFPGIGFRISILWAGTGALQPVVTVSGINIVFRSSGAARPAGVQTNRMVPVDFPDQTTLEETVDKYRVVSMSAWLAYQGSDLQNGGQHAALYYAGGQSPFSNGLTDYDAIAEVPGAYQGPLKLGSYTWWKPGDPRTMLFRHLNPAGRWALPYIALMGLASTPTQIEALRLRVVTNFEIYTTSQIFQRAYERPNLSIIEEAILICGDFPTSMENPMHNGMIADVLDRAANGAKGVAQWTAKNAEWLLPAAMSAAALL